MNSRSHGSELGVSLWAVRALFCLNGFVYATWATRIPAIQSSYELSHAMLGIALMAVALGALIAMPVAGWLSTRFGSRAMVACGAAIYLIGLPIIPWVPDMSLLYVALFVFGVGHGTLDVAMNVQAVEIERRWTKPVNSSIHAWWSGGGLLGAMVGGGVASMGLVPAWHFGFTTIALTIAILPIVSRLLPVDRECDVVRSQRDEAVPGVTIKRNLRSAGFGRKSIFRLGMLGAIAFCIMAGEGAMADWSAVLLRDNLGAGEGLAAMAYAIFAIAMAGGRCAGDQLSYQLGPRRHVRVCAMVALAGVLMIVLASNIFIALAGFALIGIGFSSIVPVAFSECGRLEGVSSSAALASVSTIGYFGFLLGPPLIGFIAQWVGLAWALSLLVLTSGCTILFAAALAETVSSETLRDRNSTESEPASCSVDLPAA
ncbi:MFS transporter [Mariniblastus fucicola]|uniref:Inner membrane protein YbjJ n=1 Tax=Mariniblastus fucicola TaxID=980251 RepID=A0A5B9PHT3_9BACT|nr:MFS transporter [Mariniblastus fucicola]QEG25169.1 Inner membrane protein YbjJ [Mariniblastus fucicola]